MNQHAISGSRIRDALICLAAGPSQEFIIQKMKKLNFAVIAIDRNKASPGFAFADEKIELSTYEPFPIIAELQKLASKYRFLGVVNRSSGPPVVTAAEICRAFGLPSVTPESAAVVLNKSALLEACLRRGIPAPAHISAMTWDEVDVGQLSLPVVVKPSLSLIGKSGVKVVSELDALPAAFATAKAASFSGVVDIEQYVPGRDISLLSVVQAGQLYPIALLDELNAVDDCGQICPVGFAIPSVFAGKDEEKSILKLAETVVRVFGLQTTVLNLCCRCEPNGDPKLIEIHLDLGGDLILDALIPNSTNFDVLAFILKALSGQDVVPSMIEFMPTAVLFDKGEGLIRNRPYRIIKAFDRLALEAHLPLGVHGGQPV